MPFLGLGLHFLVALFFAVHAMRHGKQMYWLIILFSFPLLGSVVYFFAEYLPASKMERGLKSVSNKALALLDPTKALREAKHAFNLTPTVQNRMRLAEALDNAGEYQEAVQQFDACLNGPFAKDPEVCFGAAKAKFHVNQIEAAIQLLTNLRANHKDFRQEQVSILLAQCHAANKDSVKARAEFSFAVETFGTAESRAQYAIWAAKNNDLTTAKTLRALLEKDWSYWNKHSRNLHKPLLNELDNIIKQQVDAGTK